MQMTQRRGKSCGKIFGIISFGVFCPTLIDQTIGKPK
jgi:hypothetical protein